MENKEHNMKIGSNLYWSDAPDILAGKVVRFTKKRDVVIDFVSGGTLGEQNYPISLAKKFICK